MKKEIENVAKKAVSDIATKPISRKEAIKKTGYMAVSAATMMLLLNNPAQAGGGRNGGGHGGGHGSGPGGSHCNSNDQQVKPAPSKGGSNQGGIWK